MTALVVQADSMDWSCGPVWAMESSTLNLLWKQDWPRRCDEHVLLLLGRKPFETLFWAPFLTCLELSGVMTEKQLIRRDLVENTLVNHVYVHQNHQNNQNFKCVQLWGCARRTHFGDNWTNPSCAVAIFYQILATRR